MIMLSALNLDCALVLSIVLAAQTAHVKESIFKNDGRYVLDIIRKGPLLHKTVSSDLTCSRLCVKSQICVSFFYNVHMSECVLHKDDVASNYSRETTEWKYWLKQGREDYRDSCIWREPKKRDVTNKTARIFIKFWTGLYIYDLREKRLKKCNRRIFLKPYFVYKDTYSHRIYYLSFNSPFQYFIGYYSGPHFSAKTVVKWEKGRLVNLGVDSSRKMIFVVAKQPRARIFMVKESNPNKQYLIKDLSRWQWIYSAIVADRISKMLYLSPIKPRKCLIVLSYEGKFIKEFRTDSILTQVTLCDFLTMRGWSGTHLLDPRNGNITTVDVDMPSDLLFTKMDATDDYIVAVGLTEFMIFDRKFNMKKKVKFIEYNISQKSINMCWFFVVDQSWRGIITEDV